MESFSRATEEVLRRLNQPAALASCELLALIPLTLAAARAPGQGPL